MKKPEFTTQAQVRALFWEEHFIDGKPKGWRGKKQNDLPATVRVSFVNFVDHLQKSGAISEALARRVTL